MYDILFASNFPLHFHIIVISCYIWHINGSGCGAMGRAWVFLTRGPVFDSRQTMVVSGRASNLTWSFATLVFKSVDPYWYLKQKTKYHQGFSQSITGYRDYKWTWVFLDRVFGVGVLSWCGLGPVVRGLLVFLGLGSPYKHKRITLGKNGACPTALQPIFYITMSIYHFHPTPDSFWIGDYELSY